MTKFVSTLTSLLLCSFSLSLFADEQAATEKLTALGGSIRQIAQDSPAKEAAFHLSGKELTDGGLSHLSEIPQLTWLNLANTKITDAGLAQLASIKSLTRLHLENTQIGDAGLVHLAGLENLVYLNLYGTQVSDAGLQHLKGLSKLKKLYLWQSQVTPEGAKQLASAMPHTDINIGAELKKPAGTLAKGQFVRVRLEGDKRFLQIAELQILETGSGAELQKKGKARQSSTYERDAKPAVAARAIDGNTDQDYANGSVSHTNEQANPWLLVDLGGVKDISTIKLYNRGDCCGDRLKGAIVEIFDAGLNVVWTGKVENAADKSVSEWAGE